MSKDLERCCVFTEPLISAATNVGHDMYTTGTAVGRTAFDDWPVFCLKFCAVRSMHLWEVLSLGPWKMSKSSFTRGHCPIVLKFDILVHCECRRPRNCENPLPVKPKMSDGIPRLDICK